MTMPSNSADSRSGEGRTPESSTLQAAVKKLTYSEQYERDAAQFYDDTGFIAPGKDVPAAMGGESFEERKGAFRAWLRLRDRLVDKDAPDAPSGEGMPDWVARQVTSARERTRDYEDSDEPTIMRRYDKSLVWLADALTRQQSALDALAQAWAKVEAAEFDEDHVLVERGWDDLVAALTSLLDTRETTA